MSSKIWGGRFSWTKCRVGKGAQRRAHQINVYFIWWARRCAPLPTLHIWWLAYYFATAFLDLDFLVTPLALALFLVGFKVAFFSVVCNFSSVTNIFSNFLPVFM